MPSPMLTPTAPTGFCRATRKQNKLRMAIDGPSGAGKTFTALRLGFGLPAYLEMPPCRTESGLRVALICTENGSAEKYQGDAPDGIPWEFDICVMQDYAPTSYTQWINYAGQTGYDILIIDSLSHAWAGEGGALELKDRKGGNSYTAWKDITPMHNRMVEAILCSPCHIIATMRSKTEYVMEPDTNGKMVPKKIGMAPVQRAGLEYEFDVYGSLDWTHTITITKSRCSVIDGAVIVKPDAAFVRPIAEWLQRGVETPRDYYAVTDQDMQAAAKENAVIKERLRQENIQRQMQAMAQQPQVVGGNGNGNGNGNRTANATPVSPMPPDLRQKLENLILAAFPDIATYNHMATTNGLPAIDAIAGRQQLDAVVAWVKEYKAKQEAAKQVAASQPAPAAIPGDLPIDTAKETITPAGIEPNNALAVETPEKPKKSDYSQNASAKCSAGQADKISELVTKIYAVEQRGAVTQRILDHYAVASLDKLTAIQADEAINRLQAKKNEIEIQKSLAAPASTAQATTATDQTPKN